MRAYMSRRSYGQKTLSEYRLLFLRATRLTCQLPRSSSVPSRPCSSSNPSSTYGKGIWRPEPICTTCMTVPACRPLLIDRLRIISLGSRLFLRMSSFFFPSTLLMFSLLKLILVVAFATAIAAGVLVGRDLSEERQRKVITNLLKASYIMTLGKSPSHLLAVANYQPSLSSPSSLN